MKARIETATGYPAHGVSMEPQTLWHGKEALGAKLASLVSRAPALDHQGKQVEILERLTRERGKAQDKEHKAGD